MPEDIISRIKSIKDLKTLLEYFRDILEWPLEFDETEDITFDYSSTELGIEKYSSARIKTIKQIRPLTDEQPWGLFLVEFETKKLPIGMLKRILKSLVSSKRKNIRSKIWNLTELIFIIILGEKDERAIHFANFTESENGKPKLRTFSWDSTNTFIEYLQAKYDLDKLHWPKDDKDTRKWKKKWLSAFKIKKEEIISLINSHNTIINKEQTFRQYVRKCQKENINNEESVVQPFAISFLKILNYYNQKNLYIEDVGEGNKPDFHTDSFILECKSTKYKNFAEVKDGDESPLDQLIRYLKSKYFKRDYGILFSLDRFEVYSLKQNELVLIEDLSFSLIDFYEQKTSNFNNFLKKFYSLPIKREEKIQMIINTEREKTIPVNAKQFNKILKSLKNQTSLALIENFKKFDITSDDIKLIKNKICDIKIQMDLSLATAEKEYISQTAFIYLARIILTKCWEDLCIIDPPNTYDGGFESYFKSTKGKINEVFQIAINKFQNIYHLFDPSNPYLVIKLPDDLIIDIFLEFSKCDFQNLGQDILGYIYEDYLDRENRKHFGQFYTPPYIVNLILDRVGYIPRKNRLLNYSILDPASGSGSFLLSAVRRVIESKKDGQDHSGDYKIIIENQIYGSELMLFPYLLSEINMLLQFSRIIRNILNNDINLNVLNVFPNNSFNLIDKSYGSRLFEIKEDQVAGDGIMDPALTKIKKIKLKELQKKNDFDFVVGNPPYVSNDTNPELFQELKSKFTFCNKTYSNKMDLFYWFVIIGILKLKPGGKLGYITTKYWLSKGQHTGVESLKEYILKYCYIREIIDFENVKVFSSAKGQDNIIFVLERKSEDLTDSNIKIFEIAPRPMKGKCPMENCKFSEDYCKNDDEYLECICSKNQEWDELIENPDLPLGYCIKAYYSAKKTNNLKKNRSWDLFYKEGGNIDIIIKEIEKSCEKFVETEHMGGLKSKNVIKTHIGDYFEIRNGITTIADDYFILTDEKLKILNNNYFVKIESTKEMKLNQKKLLIKEYQEIMLRILRLKDPKADKSKFEQHKFFFFDNEGILWLRLSEIGLTKIKKSYKTPAIYRHGLKITESIGKMIFFNKELEIYDCPALLLYLRQYKDILVKKLLGYNEWTTGRPDKWVTIRRGGMVKLWNKERRKTMNTDLEMYYESKPKIFFNYIMKTNNIFGFYDGQMVATSDLYFFHHTKKDIKISYILAYLNSKLMSFFFANRPITIKRSKSNIENDVPVFLPRNKNEKSLCNLISILERKLIKKLQEYEKTYRMQGFHFDLELNEINDILVNYQQFIQYNKLDLSSIDDLAYKIDNDQEIHSVDRYSFPLIIKGIDTINTIKSLKVKETEDNRIFYNRSFKIYCSNQLVDDFQKVLENFQFYKEHGFNPNELLELRILSKKEFNLIYSIKTKIYNSLRKLKSEDKAKIEKIVENILKNGNYKSIEALENINEFIYFIDIAFIKMMIPNHQDFIFKNP
ncbi:MAG: N-6 DNA methylase [Promethearchaeota archaeon]